MRLIELVMKRGKHGRDADGNHFSEFNFIRYAKLSDIIRRQGEFTKLASKSHVRKAGAFKQAIVEFCYRVFPKNSDKAEAMFDELIDTWEEDVRNGPALIEEAVNGGSGPKKKPKLSPAMAKLVEKVKKEPEVNSH